MLALLGILMVFAAVLGGYMMEHGNPWVLVQPAEFLIIGGAATGIVVVSNSRTVIRKMITGAFHTFRKSLHDRDSYLGSLRMLYETFVFAQRNGGIMALESHVEDPDSSGIFQAHAEFLKDKATRTFLCDSLRMLVIGATNPYELDVLMDLDIEVQRRSAQEPVKALSSVADSLPGLGIVAAVLGVVITMEAINGSPDQVGQKVAAALVGTFLGILTCYGVAQPIAARMDHANEAQSQYLQVLRIAMVAFARGASPILAVEYARRSIPIEVRPTFLDMESTIRRDAKLPNQEKNSAAAAA